MRERTIYECEHCNKKRLVNKSQMKEHEKRCWLNKARKSCWTCVNYTWDQDEQEETHRYCKALKKRFLTGLPDTNCNLWEEPNEINDPYEQFI